eukprot:TRINITY_DN17036_c1_g1_i7.p2 TRINITY_DN17036_c1_g1~~TRINITY_DN17036_c1_g1_i7.p2  ORF type:complete len:202 (+),score=40.67 TRINITY_DN17036_c1_g1_i7:177-782(+)
MLSVNSNAYNRFMNGKYKNEWSAAENSTFGAATSFFRQEEKLGKNAVGKVRAKKKSGKPELPDVSDVVTDGLTWLTPGEVRKEMAKLTKDFKTSIAALARLAGCNNQTFGIFSGAKGDWGGSKSDAYRSAADLVEKVRIALKKPKGRKRVALEAEHADAVACGRRGQPFLGHDPSTRFICFAHDHPYLARDELGRKVVKYR